MPAPNVGSESLLFADEVDHDDARCTAPINPVLRAVAKIPHAQRSFRRYRVQKTISRSVDAASVEIIAISQR